MRELLEFFKRRKEFNLYLYKGNHLTCFINDNGNELHIYKSNREFIKGYLKLSTKKNSYRIKLSNKRFYGCDHIIEKYCETSTEIVYKLGSYRMEFCPNHLLYYFKKEVPTKIYIGIEKITNP